VSRALATLITGAVLLLPLPPGPATPAGAASSEPPPTFSSSEPEAPLGRSAGEPSLGVTHTIAPPALRGRVMYIAGLETLRTTYDDCTSPPEALWEDVSFPTTTVNTLDPILFTDPQTGRTWASQLAGKTSIMAFTDDEGETWTPSQGGGINSGVDHQTVGGGPYPAGDVGSINSYPNAVYYCSQDVGTAQCALSRDGGLTFGPAVPIYAITECGGLHGHIKVGPNGTAYVPNPSCNRQGDPLGAGEPGVVRSTDAGITWTVHTVTGARTIGSSDPAVGIGASGALYLGYEDQGRGMVATSYDRGENWAFVRDVSSEAGLNHIVFPQVTAGDDDRAAIAFLGTDYAGPGDPEGDDVTLPAVWYLYVAATYDGGDSWTTVNATPGDPVQRGTICGAGPTCGTTRNLLDFNDVTIDREGRIMAAYADGCIGGCLNGPPNSRTEVAKTARQVSGKRLFSAFDPAGTEPPAAVRVLALIRDNPSRVELSWEEPDDRLTPISGYNVYRRRTDVTAQPQVQLATLGGTERSYSDTAIGPSESYAYEVAAVNANGEGDRCREVDAVIPPPRFPCTLPGDLAVEDPADDQLTTAALDILSLHVAEPAQPDRVDRLVFTLEVQDLPATLTPGNAWVIPWNRPIPDAEFDRNYVAMRADATGAATFEYGKVSPPSVNQAISFGEVDSGSFSADDDTIVISISTDKIDDVAAGQDLTGLEVRTFPSNVSGMPVTQLSADDFTAAGFYNLVGNASCDPRPFALDDSASTPENQPVTIDVLANDVDGDGDPLAVTALSSPANGIVTNHGDGTVTYTPNFGFVGTDGFTYSASDPGGLTDTASVTVVVYRSAPFQNPVEENDSPDLVPGVDEDGYYTLSWSFPPPPDSQPCGFRIEEAGSFASLFGDDAEEILLAGENVRWVGDPQWISGAHPDTETLSYSPVYVDQQNISLTMRDPLALPAGPTRVRLEFDSFEDIENDFDYGRVQVSADGGPFTILATFTGQFSGRRVIDLSAFAGRSIRVRFNYLTDQLVSAPLYLGWFIDNVAIVAADFAPLPATVGAASRSHPIEGRPNGTYSYRVAGLFGAGCDIVGPYSNVRDITVELDGGTRALPPTADFTAAPNPAGVNETVTFDGSASHDNDAIGAEPQIVRYFWSFGDGQTQTTTVPTTTHAYGAAGTYRATLTVTDNDDQTASAELFVEVTGEGTMPGERKATGGGWIPSGNGRANFGFDVSKALTGATSGHLSFHDKDGRVKVTSESIDSLSITGNRATFTGTCSVNKASGFTFTVDAFDNGQSGSSDLFEIRLSDGYQASGTLGGGNIRIHE
jgi:hypothetical protein